MKKLSSYQILTMRPGPLMDLEITTAMQEISDEPYINNAYSTDPTFTILLWDFLELCYGTVGIVRMGDAPKLISVFCSIREEDESLIVNLHLDNWMEALCKTFLLYYHTHYGDYYHPLYTERLNSAPPLIIH